MQWAGDFLLVSETFQSIKEPITARVIINRSFSFLDLFRVKKGCFASQTILISLVIIEITSVEETIRRGKSF